MDKQKTGAIVLTLIIVGILSFIGLASKNKGGNESKQIQAKIEIEKTDTIFFYGNTCPHCADVEKWMEENNVEEKIKITKKEVYENQANAQELTQAAEKCRLPTDSIGVPFLYAEGKCLVGTPEVTEYLSVKTGIVSEIKK